MISAVCTRAVERARVDLRDLPLREKPAERVRLRDPLVTQGKVGKVTVEDTLGVADVAVANQVEAGRNRGLAHSRRCYGMRALRRINWNRWDISGEGVGHIGRRPFATVSLRRTLSWRPR